MLIQVWWAGDSWGSLRPAWPTYWYPVLFWFLRKKSKCSWYSLVKGGNVSWFNFCFSGEKDWQGRRKLVISHVGFWSWLTTTVTLVCNSMEAVRIDLRGLTLLKYSFLFGWKFVPQHKWHNIGGKRLESLVQKCTLLVVHWKLNKLYSTPPNFRAIFCGKKKTFVKM